MTKQIEVQGISVGFINTEEEDYICITDIARYKNPETPAYPPHQPHLILADPFQ